MKTTIENSKSYSWGEVCTAWQFVNTPTLSVIRETMPPGSSELLHKHSRSQQFFYVVSGQAHFELDGETYELSANEGIHVRPKQMHRIFNSGSESLELLVISEPHSHSDRVNI